MGFNAARTLEDGRLVGGYATVWKVEDKGKYSSVQLSTSKKKEDGTYENDFSDFVSFVGPAHEMAKGITEMTRIQIRNADVTKYYSKKTDKNYYNFTVFEFDFMNAPSNNASKKPKNTEAFMEIPDSDEEEMPWDE